MNELYERTLALLREGTLPVMLPLILCAVGICYLVVERSLYLFGGSLLASWAWPPLRRRVRRMRAEIGAALEDYLRSPTPESRDAVLRRCRAHRNPYTSFVGSVVADDAFTAPTLKDLQLAETALREEIRILRNLGMLSTFAKTAPLLGLFGTVTGMIQTFRVMMFASTGDPRALSAGISIALIATEVGLAVSIPGVIGSSWLHRRAQTLLEEIHLVSMRLRQGLGPRPAREAPA